MLRNWQLLVNLFFNEYSSAIVNKRLQEDIVGGNLDLFLSLLISLEISSLDVAILEYFLRETLFFMVILGLQQN